MATAVNQGATGNLYIDGVLSGVKWSGTVTYSFPDSASDYPASYSADNEPLNGFAPISAAQQTAVNAIMQQIVNYTNLTITFAGTNGADIRLAHSNDPSTAWAYYPSNDAGGAGGDVWFGNGYTNPVVGNYEYLTHIHELGHSFGLKHGQEVGGPGNVAVPADRDALEYTVMTYRSYQGGPLDGYTNEQWGFPQTFMMIDIAALQTMYGADFNYNSGNTVYSWTPNSGNTYIDGVAAIVPGGNRIFMTVWDGGGTDTYDFSAYSTSVTIDLGPGDYSIASPAQLAYLGDGNYAHGNVYNAYLFQGDARSYIENAIGGGGSDFIYGNDIANVLEGGAGNDTIYGLSGNDILRGGTGADTLYGGLGDDRIGGKDGDDLIYGEDGNDFLWGDAGNDILTGGPGNDTLYGYIGNDILRGDAGADILYAGAGDDKLGGKDGDDILFGEDGNDLLWGDAGNDTLDGGLLNDTLNGGVGNDVLIGGSGNDTFVFADGWGNDTINDFTVGQDHIDLTQMAGLTMYSQLTFTNVTGGVEVAYGAVVITVLGQTTASLTEVNFYL